MNMIRHLMSIEARIACETNKFENPDNWQSLHIDYYPPVVERLWMQWDETHRLYLHYIHPTTEVCLFHKHRWPAAFKMIKGSYEMGVARCEEELNSTQAYNLPITATFLLSAGSYYEMTDTHSLHYVKPLSKPSMSLMLTGNLYPEDRKEAEHPKLHTLSEERKSELLKQFLQEICKTV